MFHKRVPESEGLQVTSKTKNLRRGKQRDKIMVKTDKIATKIFMGKVSEY